MGLAAIRKITRTALLCLALAVPPAGAATPLHTGTRIVTDDWYPLPENQIRTTVMDAALEAITAANRFALDANGDKPARLRARITLVGPERIVQLGLRLDIPGRPTLVVTSAIAVEGLGHRGFFEAFRYVGEQAGTEITDRLAAREQAEPGDGTPIASDRAIARRFSQAKEAKRAGEFASARRAFVAVTEMAGEGQERWAQLARNELEFGLLVTEAQHLSLRLAEAGAGLLAKERMARLAEHRLRQALAQNRTDPERNLQVQRLLDRLDLVMRGLEAAKTARTHSLLRQMRMMMTERYMRRGKCPDDQAIRELSRRRHGRLELQAVSGSDSDRSYTFVDPGTELERRLRCWEGRIDVVGRDG
jgi:hypothetical protein